MKRYEKWIYLGLYLIYTIIYLQLLFGFARYEGSSGIVLFLFTMILFNILYGVFTYKVKPNLMAIILATFYFVWFTIVLFEITPVDSGILPAYTIHYLWINLGYYPAKLTALNAYFETVLAVSVYAIPLLLLLNVDLFKKFGKDIKKG
ncbi:hypothetical protein N7603_06250 [Acholeplasma vituli]|uniref:Uncharacterized protein n=1 Tax=Paracholeplasma vituli TaxID=69473 RepID=A0ABT2PWC3_9MOLU|nr:hypothetical protein [Paracholeplasma vituli]MCU0105255.1 hypothetical protein [Paracholeplasma vituli]